MSQALRAQDEVLTRLASPEAWDDVGGARDDDQPPANENSERNSDSMRSNGDSLREESSVSRRLNKTGKRETIGAQTSKDEETAQAMRSIAALAVRLLKPS
jgi:hypothetical protein